MADETRLNELLDRWEDLRSRGPSRRLTRSASIAQNWSTSCVGGSPPWDILTRCSETGRHRRPNGGPSGPMPAPRQLR